jgi:hypothetical protein
MRVHTGLQANDSLILNYAITNGLSGGARILGKFEAVASYGKGVRMKFYLGRRCHADDRVICRHD